MPSKAFNKSVSEILDGLDMEPHSTPRGIIADTSDRLCTVTLKSDETGIILIAVLFDWPDLRKVGPNFERMLRVVENVGFASEPVKMLVGANPMLVRTQGVKSVLLKTDDAVVTFSWMEISQMYLVTISLI